MMHVCNNIDLFAILEELMIIKTVFLETTTVSSWCLFEMKSGIMNNAMVSFMTS